LTTATVEVEPTKPSSGGNRFVRALGKVNPLRWTKRRSSEPAKTALKKD